MAETLLSVGIDIGTSTTQLVFSKLYIENVAAGYSVPKMAITNKEIIYKSDIHFTPLKSATEIDADAVLKIIQAEYAKAGISIKDTDTGAVIITGETARKENAKAVLEAMSAFSGDFVVATAGADLESIISGKGAGADLFSKERHTICANFDIGGGTTNIAVFNRGKTQDTACFDIGGRLIRFDTQRKITYISPKIKQIIQSEHFGLSEGNLFDIKEAEKIMDIMVDVLCQSVGIGSSPYFQLLMTHKGITADQKIEYISFSGGVAEGIYKNVENPYAFGDIGLLLGKKIKESALCREFKLAKSRETIRATVVGAGSHTTEISGSTIYYTPSLLPLKSLPVLKIQDETHIREEFCEKIKWFEPGQTIAISLKGKNSPSFSDLSKTAEDISNAVQSYNGPIIAVFEEDMGKAMGYALQQKLPNRKIISIDNIRLQEGDYIDIGNPTQTGNILPVIVKTLLFQ